MGSAPAKLRALPRSPSADRRGEQAPRLVAGREATTRELEAQIQLMRKEVAQLWAEVEARNYEIFVLRHQLAQATREREEAGPDPHSGWFELAEAALEPTEPSEFSPEARLPASTSIRSVSIRPNRRQHERCPAEVKLEFTHDTEFFAGVSRDVSCGGVFIATYQLFPIGTRLGIELELETGECIRTVGEVRWLRESPESDARPGMGVAFTELCPAALAAIEAFCRGRPPLLYE